MCVEGDSNAVEDFLGYIGVEVQITTFHLYFLGHLWKIIIGKQRFKVRRTMDIKARVQVLLFVLSTYMISHVISWIS